MIGDCPGQEIHTEPVNYVIDGGSLLQKIPWKKKGTFGDICEQYYQYLSQKYSNITIVFDGYTSGPSTKDIIHVRRNMGTIGTPVRFTKDTPFRSNKDAFLKNTENKQNFILLLGTYLEENGLAVRYADSDADVLIVYTAIEHAETTTTYVIGEDTDLLVLLSYHAKKNSKKIFLRSDTKQTKTKPNKVWDIHKTQTLLTIPVCKLLPFLHAITGCDTTSRVYGTGKTFALNMLCLNHNLQEVGTSFMASASKEEVVRYGEWALLLLLGEDT